MTQEEYEKYTIKSLDYIENTITRMGNDSLKIKAYSLTFFSVIIAILRFNNNFDCITYLGTFLAILLASLIDAHYLNIERNYRNLYEIARTSLISHNQKRYEPLNLKTKYNNDWLRIFKAWLSFSVCGFYLILFIIACIFLFG